MVCPLELTVATSPLSVSLEAITAAVEVCRELAEGRTAAHQSDLGP
jgi:hypothetical protein